jgi:hypothetical protein
MGLDSIMHVDIFRVGLYLVCVLALYLGYSIHYYYSLGTIIHLLPTTSNIAARHHSSIGPSILSFNIFMRPGIISTYFWNNDYKTQRLEAFCRDYLNLYDIVALQEMFSAFTYRMDYLLSRAKECGFIVAVIQDPKFLIPDLSINGGLILLSKLPVIDHASLVYSRGAADEYFVAKGALYANIDTSSRVCDRFPFRSLHVFTTHTQSSFSCNGRDIRMVQIIEFCNFLAKQLQSRPKTTHMSPILICGDWNILTTPCEPNNEYNSMVSCMNSVLEKHGYRHLKDLNPTSKATFFDHADVVNSRTRPSECLDYMFIALPISATHQISSELNVDEFSVSHTKNLGCDSEHYYPCRLSDHCGLSTTLSIESI